ncbi:MAG: hypothetical protein HRS57_03505 [Mycoplasmataceae bacterium]|nr:hypothetical protein [Mycoplasmataceae bacterium]
MASNDIELQKCTARCLSDFKVSAYVDKRIIRETIKKDTILKFSLRGNKLVNGGLYSVITINNVKFQVTGNLLEYNEFTNSIE